MCSSDLACSRVPVQGHLCAVFVMLDPGHWQHHGDLTLYNVARFLARLCKTPGGGQFNGCDYSQEGDHN